MEWFKKHKILTAVLAVILIAIIATAAGGSDNSTNDSANNNSDNSANASNEESYRFNDRADKQPKDVEVLPGESATVDGVQMTLTDVQYTNSITEYDTPDAGYTYLVATVKEENVSNETKPYNTFNYRVQTAGGQVLDGAFTLLEGTLGSGDLVAGGSTTGKIVFEVPVEEGHQYVIWKPNAFNADRAIVQVK